MRACQARYWSAKGHRPIPPFLARLRPGDSATLVGEVSGWYIVALANGTRGYVSKAWTIVRADDDREALAATPHKVHVIDVGTGLAVFVEGLCASLLRR